MSYELTEEQEKIKQVLTHKRRALVCSKTGSGKTLAVLASFEALKKRGVITKLIVLAPKNAYDKQVWKAECEKHTSLKAISLDRVKALSESNPRRVDKLVEGYDVIFGKHSHLKNSLQLLCYLRNGKVLVCLDEAHTYKSPFTKQTLLCRAFLKGVYACYMLTATPLSKDMADTYHIINLLKPGVLGTFDWFRDNICLTAKARIKTATGRRELIKITGVRNKILFHQLIDGFVISGKSVIKPNFHKLQYSLSPEEYSIYRKIARGIEFSHQPVDKVNQRWLESVLKDEAPESEEDYIKAIDLHSSRFIYLQMASDGIVQRDGALTGYGSKLKKALEQVDTIVSKGESCILYFDYYATLDTVKVLLQRKRGIRVLEASGRQSLLPQDISEARVKQCPHVILMTRAGSAAVSLYYINNMIFIHVPTVPETFIQAVGRVTRLDSLQPDNINIYVCLNEDISEYKMRLVTSKAEQMGIVAGKDENIPDWYRGQTWNERSIKEYKKYFLWK